MMNKKKAWSREFLQKYPVAEIISVTIIFLIVILIISILFFAIEGRMWLTNPIICFIGLIIILLIMGSIAILRLLAIPILGATLNKQCLTFYRNLFAKAEFYNKLLFNILHSWASGNTISYNVP